MRVDIQRRYGTAHVLPPSMLLHPNNIHGREHFFVRDGKIEYLQDCDHPMAGMTVDMVDVDGEEVDP